VNELVASNHDSHMRGSGRDGREEHEVARFERPRIDVVSNTKLLMHVAWHADPVLTVDVLHEPTAIKSLPVAAAIAVWHSAKRERRRGNRITIKGALGRCGRCGRCGGWDRCGACAAARGRIVG
jgi:hypothetical protein